MARKVGQIVRRGAPLNQIALKLIASRSLVAVETYQSNTRKWTFQKMAKDQQNTGGGAATHAGTNYQNRVAAWSAVHILAEQDAVPPLDLPASVTLETLHAETPHAVDDLAVETSDGGSVKSQAKHTLSLQTTADSPFGSASRN